MNYIRCPYCYDLINTDQTAWEAFHAYSCQRRIIFNVTVDSTKRDHVVETNKKV